MRILMTPIAAVVLLAATVNVVQAQQNEFCANPIKQLPNATAVSAGSVVSGPAYLQSYATSSGPDAIFRNVQTKCPHWLQGRNQGTFYADMSTAMYGGVTVTAEAIQRGNAAGFNFNPPLSGAAPQAPQPIYIAELAPAYEAAPEQAGDFIIAADGVTRIPVTRVTAAQAAPAYEVAPVAGYASVAPAIDTAAIAREAARLVPAQAAPEIDAFAIAQQAAGMIQVPAAPTIDVEAIAADAASRIQVPAAPTVDLQEVARQAAGMIQVPAAPTIDVEAIAADAASRIEIDVDAIASNAANRIKVPSNTGLWATLAGLGGLTLLGLGGLMIARRRDRKVLLETVESTANGFEAFNADLDSVTAAQDELREDVSAWTADVAGKIGEHGDLTLAAMDQNGRTAARITEVEDALYGAGDATADLVDRTAALEGLMKDGHARLSANEETIAYQGERLDEIEDHENVIRPIAGETKKPADLRAMNVGDEFVHALLVNGKRTEFRGRITGRATRKPDVFVMIEGVSEKPELSARALSRVKPFIRDNGAPEPMLRLAHG